MSNDYSPRALPLKGEDLEPNFQYAIDPVARAIVQDVYGLQVPKVVTCISRYYPAVEVYTRTTVLKTGQIKERTIREEERPASFLAFFSLKNQRKFTLDLAKVAEMRPFYADLQAEVDEKETRKIAKPKKEPKPKVKIDLSLLLGV